MVRRRRSILPVALLGVLAALALPSSGSALVAGIPIALTASGPSPAVQKVPAGLYPYWLNQDTVAHTVTFENGCSIELAPGEQGQCADGFSNVVGDYAYTVDGTTPASVSVTAEGRTVTLEAKRHAIRHGSELLLHGDLAIATLSPPALQGPRMPLTVFARPDRHHPFHRVKVVTAKPLPKAHFPARSVWHLRVRPSAHTIYIVEANSQPAAGQYWQEAWSKPFRVRVSRR